MPIVTGDEINNGILMTEEPLSETTSIITTVMATNPDYSSTFVDLKWIPRANLLTHIEGSSWIVEYYSQVLDTNTNLSGQQYTKSAVYQSYTLIKNMEMKVTSPLSTSQDAESKGMSMVGTALLYPFIIPNEGDMFVADIGEGKHAIFRITDSIKKSIFKEACYEITYGLQDDDNNGSLDNLSEKVIKELFFRKDFLTFGQNPLLISSDNDTLLKLGKAYSILSEQYFKKFFSNEYKTMLVPAQSTSLYDHFLVDYLLSEFTTNDSQDLRYIKKLNLDDDDAMKCDSIWKALKHRDSSYLNTAFKRAGIVSSRTFTSDPMLQGIRYTGIDNVVYPNDPVLSVDYIQLNQTKPLSEYSLTPSILVPGITNAMVRAINLKNVSTAAIEAIFPVTIDDYYVLSNEFYSNSASQSVLEKIVWDYLNNESIDSAQLLDTAKNYFKWGIVEQFYYIPIIMTLIRSTIRGM